MKNTDLAKKIKELRNRKALSQEELSNLSGLSLRTIQRIENGETEARGDTLKRLANALGVTADELIDWEEQEDHGLLAFMNLSALCFIVFPLLGVIIPMAIWMLKKGKVKYINETGKKLLNFQITWCIGLFLGYIFFILVAFFHVSLPFLGNGDSMILNMGIGELILIGIPIGFYLFNLVLILVNSVRSVKAKKVFYQPAIPFLR